MTHACPLTVAFMMPQYVHCAHNKQPWHFINWIFKCILIQNMHIGRTKRSVALSSCPWDSNPPASIFFRSLNSITLVNNYVVATTALRCVNLKLFTFLAVFQRTQMISYGVLKTIKNFVLSKKTCSQLIHYYVKIWNLGIPHTSRFTETTTIV